MTTMILFQSTSSHHDGFKTPSTEMEHVDSGECKNNNDNQHLSVNSINSISTIGYKSDHAIDEFEELHVIIEHGYKIISKIKDTLQGEILRAQTLEFSSKQSQCQVAIKKTDKSLFKQRVTIRDEITYCVTENIVKEALILNLLTIENKPTGNYIGKYIDFFEDEKFYYLVMEYIPGNINLKDFVYGAHKYMKRGKLRLKEYHKTIKYLMWQLSVTLRWLHDDINCCHLDICMENVMLSNCEFHEQMDGYYTVNPNIQIKLSDFGVAEIFKTDPNRLEDDEYQPFNCVKPNLSLDNEISLAPEINAGIKEYDARCADMWSLGILIYQCVFGEKLFNEDDHSLFGGIEEDNFYQTDSFRHEHDAMYWMLKNENKFKLYLKQEKLLQFVNKNICDIILNLLKIKPNQRMIAMDVLKHKWFKTYWKQYHKRIEKKMMVQRKKSLNQYKRLKHFPYYSLDEY